MKMADVSGCIVHAELPVEKCFHQISELMKTGDDENLKMLAWKKNDLFSHKKGIQEETLFCL